MKKPILLLLLLGLSAMLPAQENPTGIFEFNKDIGTPKLAGSVLYDSAEQVYTIKGAGSDIGGRRDAHRYVYNLINGDFIATANFKFEGSDENDSKIGWMARATEADTSVMIGGFLHGDGLLAGLWRERTGADPQRPEDVVWAPKRFYDVIQLERRGHVFILRAAHAGEPLQEISSKQLYFMPEELLLGIVISSPNVETIETAKVWNVRVDRPVDDNYKPWEEGWLGCRLETMNVFDGKRKVIHEKDGRFEAPNWMPHGKELLFNEEGSLYTIPINGGATKKLNTGSAADLNNDHCISFDGKLLGISHNDGKGSNVFTLPLSGGEPVAVTTEAPSYLHGWSPNNNEVVYVAQRNGTKIYDIYRKPIQGGKEVKLTDNKPLEHADGCEYSPDGKYIYYNGSKNGGTMQLWRMRPDGSGKEQLTFDQYNDWFPHISPDGKWIAFISFPPDIELNSHPSFQRVMLRLMPTTGGAPKVIAHLYGGQGTINVNSWSPDSRHIAFVSNSGKTQ